MTQRENMLSTSKHDVFNSEGTTFDTYFDVFRYELSLFIIDNKVKA